MKRYIHKYLHAITSKPGPSASVLAAFVGWTAWVVAMAFWGEPFDRPLPRAFARVSAVLVPALVCLRRDEEGPPAEALGLGRRPARAVGWGVLAGIAMVAPRWWGHPGFRWPVDLASWINGIVGSPVAEELLFRGVVDRNLAARYGRGASLAASSLLFAAFHLPAWVLLGGRPAPALAFGFGQMVVYGVVFAGLFRATGSLWCPVAAHVVNNLAIASLDAGR